MGPTGLEMVSIAGTCWPLEQHNHPTVFSRAQNWRFILLDHVVRFWSRWAGRIASPSQRQISECCDQNWLNKRLNILSQTKDQQVYIFFSSREANWRQTVTRIKWTVIFLKCGVNYCLITPVLIDLKMQFKKLVYCLNLYFWLKLR